MYLAGETEKAAAVFVSDGVVVTGLNLYQNRLIVRDIAGVSITNDHLYTAHDTNSDLLYAVSGASAGNLTVDTGIELHVWDGTTFAPGGNVTTQGSNGHLHIDNNAVFTGASTQSHAIGGDVMIDSLATLTAPTSGTITVSGSWNNAGAFSAGTGAVVFNSAASEFINAGGSSFWNLTTNNASGTWALSSSLTVGNVLNINSGTFNAGSNTITLTGSDGSPFLVTGTFNAGTSTVSYESTVSANVPALTYYNLQTSPASGTPVFTIANDISVNNNISLAGAGSGTLNANTYDAVITLTGTLTIGSGQTFSASSLSTMTIGGSLVQNGSLDHNFGSVIFDSAGAQSLSGANSVTLNNTTFAGGGEWTLPSNISFGNFIVTLGSVTAPAGAMEIRGNFTNNGFFNANGGTITMTSSSTAALAGTLTSTSAFNNIVFNNALGSWTFNNDAAFTGSFSITAATAVTAPLSGTLTVAGNFAGAAAFSANSGTVILNGGASTTQAISGATTFYNLSASAAASRTLEFAASTTYTISNNLSLAGASCGVELNLDSSIFGTAYTITVDAGTVVSLNYLNIRDLTATYAMTANHSQDLGGNSNITINAGDCSLTSTSSTATGFSFQRKTFHDATNSVDWIFVYDGHGIKYNYSANSGTSWANSGSLDYNTNDYSVWNASISGTDYVWVAVASGNDIILRRGTLSSTSITWDSADPVVVALDGVDANDTYAHTYLTLDSSNNIWVLARHFDGTNYAVNVVKSVNTAATTWDAATFTFNVKAQLNDSQANSNVFGNIVSLGSGNMYAAFVSNTALEGCKWVNTASAWQDSDANSCTPVEGAGEDPYTLYDGLVAQYEMDEADWDGTSGEVKDSAQTHHGTSFGTLTTVASPRNRAGSFGGSGHILVPDSNDFSFGDGSTDSSFSISTWIKHSSQGRIIAKYVIGSTALIEYDMSVSNTRMIGLRLFTSGTGGYIDITSTTAIPSGEWAHVAVTYDGSKTTAGLKLYIDGSLATFSQNTGGVYSGMSNTDANVTIGARRDTVDAPFNQLTGVLDDLRVYNRGLTTDEIAQLAIEEYRPQKIDDNGDPGALPGVGRQVVRTSDSTLYTFINNSGSCEIWKSADGEVWTQQASATNVACNLNTPTAAAIDNNQDIHVIYVTGIGDEMAYRIYDTATDSWQLSAETVFIGAAGNVARDLAISVDNLNYPHAVYTYSASGMMIYSGVNYRNRVGGSWQTNRTVQSSSTDSDRFHTADITINASNVPEVSYLDSTNSTLSAAVGDANNPTAFTTYGIDTTVNVTTGVRGYSIGVEKSTTNTWITYVDADGTVALAKYTGDHSASQWTSTYWTTITDKTDVGYEPSVAVNGKDIYVFYENDLDDIVYDVYDTSAATWAGETILHSGTFQDVKAKWSLAGDNYSSNRIDYLFSDGTDIYWDYLELRDMPTNVDDASDFGKDAGLVGYWPIDEGAGTRAHDRSGNGNDGVVAGGSWISGKYGKGFATANDAVRDYISITNPASGELNFDETQDYTTSMWLKWTGAGSGFSYLAKGGNNLSTPGYTILINQSERIDCRYNYGDGTNSETASFVASGKMDGNWHYVSCVMDRDGSIVGGGTPGLYMLVNGVIEASDTALIAATTSSNTNALTFGDLSTGTSQADGALDEVRIYNYARTQQQIIEDMLSTNPNRKTVRTSGGDIYSFMNNGGNCEIWKSSNGSVWTQQDSLTTIACTDSTAMTIDSADTIHLVYSQASADAIYRTFSTSTDTFSGTTATITDVTNDFSIAVDANDIPHVAGIDAPTGYVNYKNKVGGSWNATVAVEAVKASGVDITFNGSNYPEISYFNITDNDLTAAIGTSNNPTLTTSFTKYDVDVDVGDTRTSSIAIDADGNTWIAYVDENGADDYITLAKHNAADGWTTWQTPATNSNVGYKPSLTISGNTIYVFYQDENSVIVLDAYDRASATWAGETILDKHGYLSDVKSATSPVTSTGIDYNYSDGTDVFYNLYEFPAVTSTPGSQDAIDTVPNGLAYNISAVADSLGNVHLAYFADDTGIKPKYKKWNGSAWDLVATAIDTAIGSFASLSIDTATDDLYYLWHDTTADYINYKQYDLSATSWLTKIAWKNMASGAASITSNYSGAGRIFGAWTEGSSSPYTVGWDLILGSTGQTTIQVSNVSLNNDTVISLTEGTTTTITWTGTVTDTDGYADIGTVTGKAYRSGVTGAEACSADDNNCYADTSCSLSACAGNSCTATCTADFAFFAEPTDTGSPYSAQYWRAYISATDTSLETAENFSAVGSVELETMSAMDIDASISYGALQPGEDSGTTNVTETIVNTGNTTLNLEVSGDNMCTDYPTCSGNLINVGYQEFSTSPFTYSTGTILTTVAQLTNLNLAKSTAVPSNSSTSLYWGISIPEMTASGDYAGTQTILAVSAD